MPKWHPHEEWMPSFPATQSQVCGLRLGVQLLELRLNPVRAGLHPQRRALRTCTMRGRGKKEEVTTGMPQAHPPTALSNHTHSYVNAPPSPRSLKSGWRGLTWPRSFSGLKSCHPAQGKGERGWRCIANSGRTCTHRRAHAPPGHTRALPAQPPAPEGFSKKFIQSFSSCSLPAGDPPDRTEPSPCCAGPLRAIRWMPRAMTCNR